MSKTALLVLMALASADDMIVHSTTRIADGYEFGYAVMPRAGVARFTVPPGVFEKLRRDGMVTKHADRAVGHLVFSEYILADAGRASLVAHDAAR